MRVSGWDKFCINGLFLLIVAGFGLTACSQSPQENCRAELDKLDQLAQSVYGRLLEKLPDRRPGGSADWTGAMEKMRKARSADSAGNHAQCIENLKQARILLKRAGGRY